MKKHIKFTGYEEENGVGYYEADIGNDYCVFVRSEGKENKFVGVNLQTDRCFILSPENEEILAQEKKKWDLQKMYAMPGSTNRKGDYKNIVFWFTIVHNRATRHEDENDG